MKKLFILSLATLSFVACEKKEANIIISGKIKNHNGGNFHLIGGNDEKNLKINPDGSFSDTLSKSSYYTIFNETGFYVPLYLEQGDRLNIEVDFSQVPAEVKFSGKDTIASAYLRDKTKLDGDMQAEFSDLFSKNLDEFKTSLADVNNKYANFLANYKGLSDNFVSAEKKSIEYSNLHLKSAYSRVHQSLTGNNIESPAEFEEELAKINYDNAEDFELYSGYVRLLTDNFYSKLDSNDSNWGDLADYVRSLKSENIKKHLSEILAQGLSAGNSSEVNEKILSVVKEFSKKEDLIKESEAKISLFQNIAPGKPSPTFDFENFAGGKTSLEKLKGKLVYIDIWATWCIPCMNEMPALQELEKEYHGKDVAFVSISIDQDKQKWIDFQSTKKPSGIQLYAESEAERAFSDAYGIKSIPRFILIDKNGNIISADAPRPSNPIIKELINKNL
ncbi:TlpA family protein disulfide reductase [Capnocytophaga stomatis]|uniref:TlpA family protein disulfide reductase n=1 Tax=Capnocytophaga stomatis TaxID=1848904 RepID=A0ABW8Q7A9_9FLAO|nr:TlpA disulfide reductase family protein [Capnocytophaga stomatis]GIJ93409.1 hypothetical protein CAPN002_06270 [Capnocytophaga stomatis]